MDSESAEGLLEAIKEGAAFLRKRIQHADPVLMRVKRLNAGFFSCDVKRIYSRRFEGPIPYGSAEFTLRGASPAWGNVGLCSDELALVFVSRFSSDAQYYEYPWHGHFTVVGETAIANWHLLNEADSGLWGPEYLRSAAFLPDPLKPNRVAMPYSLLERHLLEELMLVQPGSS